MPIGSFSIASLPICGAGVLFDMNVYEAEGLILARLKSTAAGFRTIASLTRIAGITDIAKLLPAVFVNPETADMTHTITTALPHSEVQRWNLVVVVSHVKDASDAVTTASKAGELIGEVITALSGYALADHFTPITIVGRPEPLYDTGHAEFPVLIEMDYLYE